MSGDDERREAYNAGRWGQGPPASGALWGVIQIPGVLASGAVLTKVLGRPYAGVGGYVKAVAVSVIALAVTFACVILAIATLQR